MKKLDFGFIQGRMSVPPSKNILQYFPKKNWQKEFVHARMNNFKFIEYFGERKFNRKNPIWTKLGLKKINTLAKRNNLLNYTFCDDYFISHNFIKSKKFKKYVDVIIKNLSSIKIKIYVLALLEKSEINNKNFHYFTHNLRYVSKKLQEQNIKLALETNLDVKFIKELISLVNSKNLFIVYDTGNRLKKKNLQYQEIIKLKKLICHVHLKDKNWKGQNVVLGSGSVDFKKIFKGLQKINYNGKYTFETNRGKDPIKTMNNNRNTILNIIANLNKINVKV